MRLIHRLWECATAPWIRQFLNFFSSSGPLKTTSRTAHAADYKSAVFRRSDFWTHSSGGSEQQSFHKQSHPGSPSSKQNNKTMIPADRWSDRTVTLNQACGLPRNLVEDFLWYLPHSPLKLLKGREWFLSEDRLPSECTLFWSPFAW